MKRIDRYNGGLCWYVNICKPVDEEQKVLDALLYLTRSRCVREVAEKPYVAV